MPIYKTEKKKNGAALYRVIVNYTDVSGRYRKKEKCIYGYAEAKEAEAAMLAQLSAAPNERYTVNRLFNEYITHKASIARETSLAKSTGILKRHVLPLLGNYRLSKLDLSLMKKWKDEINSKPLSITTKNGIYKELSALLNYAVKMEYISRNPLAVLGRFKEVNFAHSDDKLHYYTVQQFSDYINAAKNSAKTLNGWGAYVFFNIAFYTGMRKGEINALRWSDIDKDTIKIRRSIAQKLKGGIRETPPKNKSSMRDIRMPNQLIAILHEHRSRQQKDTRFNEEYRVCGGISVLSDTFLDNCNRAFAEAAHLPRIRIHDFRHSHASLLANEGINIQEIARRLGHSNVQTTWNTYAHLYPREEDRALKILNRL